MNGQQPDDCQMDIEGLHILTQNHLNFLPEILQIRYSVLSGKMNLQSEELHVEKSELGEKRGWRGVGIR